ncbi:MAG: hypothetical protein ABFR97_08800 [Thermodesulfobacteriota bacterium]
MTQNNTEGHVQSVTTTPIASTHKRKVQCQAAPSHELLFIPSENHFVILTEAESKLLADSDKKIDQPMRGKIAADKSKDREQMKAARNDLAKVLRSEISIESAEVRPDNKAEEEQKKNDDKNENKDERKAVTKGGGAVIEAVALKGQKYSLVPRDLYDSFRKQEGKTVPAVNKSKVFTSKKAFSEAAHPSAANNGNGQSQAIDEDAVKKAFNNEVTAEIKLFEKNTGGDLSLPCAENFNKWVTSVNDNAKVVVAKQEQLKTDLTTILNTKESDLDSDHFGKALSLIKEIWGEVKADKRQDWLKGLYKDFQLDDDEIVGASPFAKSEKDELKRLKADFQLLKQYLAPAKSEKVKGAPAEIASPFKIGRPVPDSHFSVTAQAQVMRYAAGASVASDFDLKSGVVALKADANMDFALCEGQVSGKLFLPDEHGKTLEIPVTKKVWQEDWQVNETRDLPPVTFDFNKSFLAPEGKREVDQMFNAWTAAKMFSTHSDGEGNWQVPENFRLQLIGHADAEGRAAYNQTLSEYRAKVIYGYLCCREDEWLAMFDVPEKQGGWHYREIKIMLEEVGQPVKGHGEEPLREAMSNFQNFINMAKDHFPAISRVFEKRLAVGHFTLASSDPSLAALVQAYMLTKRYFGVVATTACSKVPYYGRGEKDLEVATPGRKRANRRVACTIWEDRGRQVEEDNPPVPLGDLRLALEASLSKYAGANLMLGANVNFDASQGLLMAKGVADVGESGTKKGAEKAGAGANAAVFVGAKAELGCKGSLEWLSPEPLDSKKKESGEFVEMASVGYTATGIVGLSGLADFQIGFDQESKKFVIKAAAQAALGTGFGGKLAFSVTARHVQAFLALVYNQLKESDFNLVDFFEDIDAFDMFCAWSYKMLTLGRLDAASALALGAVGIKVLTVVDDVIDEWSVATEEQEQAENLIANINDRQGEFIKYTPPEVKGRILHLLVTPPNWYSWAAETSWHGFYHERERAIMEVLSWVQSKRDCQEVLEHMGVGISPGATDLEKRKRYNANKETILRWLDDQRINAQSWQRWYEALPETAPTGPVKQQTAIEPLVDTLDDSQDDYRTTA